MIRRLLVPALFDAPLLTFAGSHDSRATIGGVAPFHASETIT